MTIQAEYLGVTLARLEAFHTECETQLECLELAGDDRDADEWISARRETEASITRIKAAMGDSQWTP